MQTTPQQPSVDDLSRHSGLVLTAVYLFFSAIGATYYLCLFGYFGLNAFDWWDLSDFFLAALRRPIVLPFSIFALYFGWMIANPDASNQYVIQRWPRLARWSGTTWLYQQGLYPRVSAWVAVLFGAFWFLVVIYAMAAHEARSAQRGSTSAVTWQVEGGEPRHGHLLATTSRFVAVVERDGTKHRLVMVPQDSAQMFQLCGERRQLLAALRGDSPACPPGP